MKHSDFIKSAYIVLYHSKFKVEPHIQNRFTYLINSGRFEDDGSETRKKYLLNQELDNFLWDNPEAINNGFTNWKNTNLPIRLEAFRYHDDNCETQCKICEFNKNWRNKYERERPPICQ